MGKFVSWINYQIGSGSHRNGIGRSRDIYQGTEIKTFRRGMVWRQGESTGQPVTSASCSETPFQHRRSQKTEADTQQSLTEILWVEYKATRNSAQWPGKAATSIHLPFNMERQTRHLKCSPWSRSGLLLTSAFQPCGVSQSRKKKTSLGHCRQCISLPVDHFLAINVHNFSQGGQSASQQANNRWSREEGTTKMCSS